ncbi:Autophagy protein 29 [Apiospora phragmitis]|uniref:Autophagy protein 29 n=1 Tax=Apiospora phragmitis TaxID=2905665 RepID=A0ABR1VU65_9PEZI
MASPQSEPTYTVFIRLPFPRGDFVDPPPVTVDFLLQQVAFLTERHASQVRAQMRKAAAVARSSAAPSPVPGADPPATADAAQQQMGSALGRPRAPSALSIRRDSSLPGNDASIPGTPMRATPRPQSTRTLSSNTAVYTTRNLGGSGKGTARQSAAETSARQRLSSLPMTSSVDDEPNPDPPSPGPAETSSAESSSSESSPAQSRIIRRPPRFQSNDGPSFADDEEEDEPAFLPYRKQADASSSGNNDLTATLKGSPATADLSNRRLPKSHHHRIHQSQTSDSSASSATAAVRGSSTDKSRPSGPLSPRRTMELAGQSPSGKGKGYSRDSDETPSMGSSFSDLDDASVTQSALEEALASKMQDGGTHG